VQTQVAVPFEVSQRGLSPLHEGEQVKGMQVPNKSQVSPLLQDVELHMHTPLPMVVLQIGVVPEQPGEHPLGTQVPVAKSQTSPEAQEVELQTHVPLVVSQAGVVPEHPPEQAIGVAQGKG
jgi:hypothetical protein